MIPLKGRFGAEKIYSLSGVNGLNVDLGWIITSNEVPVGPGTDHAGHREC